MSKKRNSHIEIIRIISIILIVISHYCYHGAGDAINALPFGFNRIFLKAFTLGNLGSILFVLITGYYLISSEQVKLKKVFRLLFQVLFYSIIIYILMILFGKETFSLKTLAMNALPITFKAYWFVSVYILLYLFHPYINKLLNNLDRKEHLSFIWLMFIIFSILRTILMADYYGNELIQFLLFYTIGAYLYKYPDNILGRNKNNIKIMISSVFVILGSIIILEYLGINNEWIAANSTHLLSRTSPIAILFCVGLFDWASRKQHYSSKIINGISSWVFGVYLISDNMYLRPIIWDGIFKTKEYVSSSWLVLHMLVAVVLVTVICLLIDAVRKRFIEKPFFSVFDKLIDGFQEKQKKNN